MSVDTTMAVLYAQSGLSTNVANAAAVAPQASLAISRVLAAEMARQERQQVEKTDKTEHAGILPDGRRNARQFGSRRRKRMQESPARAEVAGQTSDPLVGNLLNVKV